LQKVQHTMGLILSFRDLDVWRDGMDLVEHCYRLTRSFPSEERYGLAFQIRKSSVSVPSNIAEGHERRSRAVYLNHVCIAAGSCAELDIQIEIAHRLLFLSDKDARYTSDRVTSLGRQLSALIRSLDTSEDAAEPSHARGPKP
jgi:four helix bundle protein